VIAVAIVTISSCKKDNEDENNNSSNNPSLVGTWTISESTVNITANGMDIVEYMMNTFGYTQEQAQLIEDFLLLDIENGYSGTITFNSDNTYNVVTPDDTENGTWSLSGDGKTLTLTYEDGTDNLTVVSLTSTTLILQQPTETEMIDFDDDGIDETTMQLDAQIKLIR
jgi:hypothetical protein